jgi:zinc transport system substrate-binding protein
MKKRILGVFVLLLLMAGCGETTTVEEKPEERKKVIASMYPMYDFAKRIGGEHVEVESLIGVQQSAHGWEPSAADVAKTYEADLFVYHGAGFETWVEDVLEGKDKELAVCEASHGLQLLPATEDSSEEHNHGGNEHTEHSHDEHDHGEYDPHAWLSLDNAVHELTNIADALIEIDPENAEYYAKNLEAETKKIEALKSRYESEMKDLRQRTIVVSHKAFGYLCRDWGLTQIGVEGLRAEGDPGLSEVARVTRLAKEQGIRVIFYDSLDGDTNVKAIAEEIGGETAPLYTIEGLTEEQEKAGEDYFSLMEKNLEQLVRTLK